MLRTLTLCVVAGSAVASSRLLAKPLKTKADVEFQSTFFSEEIGTFAHTGRNTYWILEPGYSLTYSDGDDGTLVVETTDAIELIEATETRVVEEREYKAGVLTDLSYNYFAISTVTHSVFYFGEDEATIVNGTAVAPTKRGWRAGENGASFGLIMPGTPLLGARYQQENAPGNTMDRAECVGVTQTVTVKAGAFTNCLLMEESDGMDPEGDTELKAYAPGVGLLGEDDYQLIAYGFDV